MPFPLIPFLAGAVVGALATHLPMGSRPGRDAETGSSPGETRRGEPEAVPAAEKEPWAKPRKERFAAKSLSAGLSPGS
jgi:hypothetical protein